MKTTIAPIRRNEQGYALIITLTFLGIMLILFSTMMYYTVSNANLTRRNNQYNASEAAAESATELVLAQMTHDFESQSLSNSSSYYSTGFLPTGLQTNWPVQYTYSSPGGSNTSVVMGAWTTNLQPLNSQYAGLYGQEQNVTISFTATPTTGVAVPATVVETVQFAYIPLFQFAIFYNIDLEIAAASTLGIQGAVYSNGGIWSGSTSITFSSTVSAVGLATNSADDPFCAGYSGSGRSTYSLAGQPTSGNDTLTMPVGVSNNPVTVAAIVNIPPTNYMLNTSQAFTTNGQLYLANAADLYVTNYPSGTNWGWSGNNQPQGAPMAVYYSDANNSPNYLTWVTNDFYYVSNSFTHGFFQTNWVPISSSFGAYATSFTGTNSFKFTNSITLIKFTNSSGPFTGTNFVWYMGYSFLTNVLFYDWREGWHGGSGPAKAVQAVQLDLKAYNNWMTNTAPNGGSVYNNQCKSTSDKSHPIDSIYVFNAVPLTTTVLPATRVMNGKGLPPQDGGSGFTLATAMPLYVWGDYNATNSSGSSLGANNDTYVGPAALMGDSISVLSDGWVDTNSLAKHSGGPNALTTTINAACLEGIVPSNTNNLASNAEGYSGGVENFLRLLENWSSINLVYNGSIIVMFPSQYATNCWQQTTGYYTAASRKWAFDTNFLIGADLPPLTPKSMGVIRGNWNAN